MGALPALAGATVGQGSDVRVQLSSSQLSGSRFRVGCGDAADVGGMDYGNPERIVCFRLLRSFWFGDIELMVDAGLTPMRAIAAATVQNAKLLHLQDRGRIAVGKRADLLVLDADPLADIRNTRKIVAVYHDGRSIADLPGK